MKKEIKDKLLEKILLKMKEQNISQAKLGEMLGGTERRVINRQLNSDQTSIEKYLDFAEALKIKVEIRFLDELE